MNQEVNGVAFDFFAPAVDFIFQIAARQNHARAQQQGLEDGKFFVAEHDGLFLPDHFCLMGGRVERDDAVAQQRLRLSAVSAQYGAHTGLQFCHVEGFDDVVVCAAV